MVNMNGFFRHFYTFGYWLAKMMILNICWIAFTLLGLGLFGIAPASLALTNIVHKWFAEGTEVPILKEFWSAYKKNFVKANGLFFVWILISLFLYMDYFISKNYIQSFYFHIILMLLIAISIASFAHFLIVFVRYELPFFHYFKQALLIALARPMETIAMFVSLIILYYLYSFLPVLTAFVGVSLTLYPILWFSYRACVSVEENKEKVEQKSKTPSFGKS
ncbi:YesL family protein [Gracilibacillus oryzae]|nr:DUF624 domain-containing protein [Gracilibacillus oryzae]